MNSACTYQTNVQYVYRRKNKLEVAHGLLSSYLGPTPPFPLLTQPPTAPSFPIFSSFFSLCYKYFFACMHLLEEPDHTKSKQVFFSYYRSMTEYIECIRISLNTVDFRLHTVHRGHLWLSRVNILCGM
jgi:hypothetical protein